MRAYVVPPSASDASTAPHQSKWLERVRVTRLGDVRSAISTVTAASGRLIRKIQRQLA